MPIRQELWNVINALVAPGDLFARSPARTGIVVLAVATAASVLAAGIFWNSDSGRSILRQAQEETISRYRSQLSADQYRRMLEHATIDVGEMVVDSTYKVGGRVALYSVGLSLVLFPVLGVVFLRPQVSWLQSLALVGYSSPILLIRELMILTLSYAHWMPFEAAGISPLLGGFGGCCGAKESVTFSDAFLTNVDPFITWWCVVIAVGIGKVYFSGSWKICIIVLLTCQLTITSVNSYMTMIVSQAIASGRPAHGGW